MKYMSWGEGLAKVAQEWANLCKFEHNPCGKPHECYDGFEYVGENIWSGGFKGFTPKSAIDAWYNESEYYEFDSLSCSQVCGHYTQVVWATSHKVGCAISICPNLGGTSSALFICNYGPAGNFANKSPYTKGASCSLCPREDK